MAVVSVFQASLNNPGKYRSIVDSTPSAYATGGDDIFYANGYWVHVFNDSGTFTPLR